jgi:hypothetical protein
VKEYLSETHTPPAIKHHICKGFFSWLEMGRYQQPIPYYGKTDSLELAATLQKQEAIEWNHFARGQMNIEWGYYINNHIANRTQYKITAEQWGAKIFQINWKYILQLRQQRNGEVHGTSPEQTEQFRQRSMIKEIQYIQSGLKHIPFEIYSLISLPVDELKQLSIHALEAYLCGAKIVARSCRHKSNQNQRTIHQILAQLPPQFHNDTDDQNELDSGKTP